MRPSFVPSSVTLALLKPDVVAAPPAVRDVLARIEASGLSVLRSRTVHWTIAEAETFYAEHRGRFFYDRLVEFMASGPMQALLLQGPDAITVWRGMLGPTHPARARVLAPDSIRARYGLSNTRNSVHGSDSPESALKELTMFFPETRALVSPV